jgi:hypothetical protein
MLNYTTTTIVNDGATVFADATKKLFRVKFGPELFNDGTIHKACLVKKQAYVAPVKATATVSLPSAEGIYRIAMYIRLRNNNNPYFSNEWVFKGKPLYVEFNGGDSAADIVARAKKYMLAQYGYNLVDFSAGADTPASPAVLYADETEYNAAKGTSLDAAAFAALSDEEKTKTPAVAAAAGPLVITAHDQWEIFVDQDNNDGVRVEKLETVDMAGKVIAAGAVANSPTHEAFVPDSTVTVTIDNGNEAFGDFAHIVKDLRLPTAANRRWQGIAEGDVMGDEPNDDKPLPTGKYTQYTIQYTSERGVLQQSALGGLGISRTVHVFYVESGAVSAFESALSTSTIGTSEVAGGLI